MKENKGHRIGKRLTGLIMVLFFLPRMSQAESPVSIMTLKQAVTLAIEHNQDLKTAGNQVETSVILHDQDRSNFYPDLTAKAGADMGRNTSPSSDDSLYRSLSLAITSTTNLFNGYGDQAAYEKSEYTLLSTRDDYQRTRQTVIFNTVSAYLDAVLKKERIRVAEENLSDNQRQLEQIEAFYKAGRRPVTDLYQQQAEAAGAKLTLLTAKAEWNTAKMKLLEILGISALTAVELSGVSDVMKSDWVFAGKENLTASALDQRYDMKSKKNEVKAADLEIKKAGAGYYPSVDLVFQLSSTYSSTDSQDMNAQMGDDNLAASAGINVTIPIFDRNITRNNVSKARIAERTVRLELEKLERQIEVEMGDALANYQTATEQVEVSRSKMAYADKALESTRQRYKAGAATLTELTTAQSSAVEARYDQVNAELTKAIKAMTISFYKGDMTEITNLVEK